MADQEELNQDEIEKLLSQSSSPSSSGGQQGETSPAADSAALNQSEIDALMGGTGVASPSGQSPPVHTDVAGPPSQPGKSLASAREAASEHGDGLSAAAGIAQGDVEYLLNQAQEALESIDAEPRKPPPGVAAFRLEEFSGMPASTENATLDLIRDVELDLKIELGRTHMYLEDVLRLRRGSVVPLDKMAGDPVDIYVNGRLIGRGEVLVLNDNFCVRVGELLTGARAAP